MPGGETRAPPSRSRHHLHGLLCGQSRGGGTGGVRGCVWGAVSINYLFHAE